MIYKTLIDPPSILFLPNFFLGRQKKCVRAGGALANLLENDEEKRREKLSKQKLVKKH